MGGHGKKDLNKLMALLSLSQKRAMLPNIKCMNTEHQKRVFILYRRALINLRDHAMARDLIVEEAAQVRAEFDEYVNETDPRKLEFLLQRGEYWVEITRHTKPYLPPNHPGGTAYLRNYLPDWFIERHSMTEQQLRDNDPHIDYSSQKN